MIVDHVEHAAWSVNSWLLAGREEGRGILIDTGADAPTILEMVRRHGVRITAIINTHRHRDHTASNDFLARNLDVPVFAPKLERPHIPTATQTLEIGQAFEFTAWKAVVIPLPGHTVGQVGIHVDGFGVWTADTLFKGSVGGTVAPGHGTFDQLQSSIMDTLMTLPDDTKIFPGHGVETTIGREREHNPFIKLWRGEERPHTRPGRVDGKRVVIELWTKDYDAGHKAQVRFADGSVEVVPGSKVQKVTL